MTLLAIVTNFWETHSTPHPRFVVIKQNGQLEHRVGQAYANLLLSAQGQNLLQAAGFVNLR